MTPDPMDYATRQDLFDIVGTVLQAMQAMEGRLVSKVELAEMEGRLVASLATKVELAEMEARLMRELGAHTRASNEEMTAKVAILDEKYADLPARVSALESLGPSPHKRTRGKSS